jgi:hypothetical protein
MAIIGEIIKRVIDVNGMIAKTASPVDAQQTVLRDLLERAKSTAFGRKYNFDAILADAEPIKAFQSTVPIYDYDSLHDEWWHYLHAGHENITWPGGQRFFALSSGTTSNSKAIPVTDDMLDSIKKAGIQQILSLKNFDLPPDFFEKDIMMLGSSTQLQEKDGFLMGEISGISAANLPLWFRRFYKPGHKIAAAKDWNERVSKIARNARKWDIGSMTGIPSWSEILLKEIIRYHNVDTIHDIWPNLRVYSTGGVAFEPYRKSFETLFARPMIYIDTYLASEGYLATQALLVDNGVFFEFVPFVAANMNEHGTVKQDAEVLTLADVEEGREYVLLISTVAGAWRYMIGDTVMFTDKERGEIVISGRTKHFLNVVGEQLSVHQMNAAIRKVQDTFDLKITEFTVASIIKNGKHINKWYLGADKALEPTSVTELLDAELQRANKNYAVARRQTLDHIEVEIIPVDFFYQWSRTYKKMGGQTKVPRVMNEESFQQLEDLVLQLQGAEERQ